MRLDFNHQRHTGKKHPKAAVTPGFVTPTRAKDAPQALTGKSLPLRDPVVGAVLKSRKKRKRKKP